MVLHIWNSARRHYLFHHYLHAWITLGCSRRNGHQDWVMLGGNFFFFLDHVLLMLSIQLTCIGKQPRICFGNIHWTSHCKLVNQASMSGVHLLFPCSSAILYFDGMQIQLGSGPGRPTESGWHVQFTLANVWLHLFLVPVGLHEISSEISEPGCIGSLNGRLSKLHWCHQLTKLLWYQNCFFPICLLPGLQSAAAIAVVSAPPHACFPWIDGKRSVAVLARVACPRIGTPHSGLMRRRNTHDRSTISVPHEIAS